MSETITIRNTSELLKALRESDILQSYSGFQSEWIYEGGEPVSLRVTYAGDSAGYRLYLTTQPTRQLLHPGKLSHRDIVIS